MFRIMLLLAVTNIFLSNTKAQVVIKVVAQDSISSINSVEEPPMAPIPSISDFFISEGFALSWRLPALQLPEPLLYESIAFKVKRFSKLKTFELILSDFHTLEKTLPWYETYPELKELKKHRLIYEGNNASEDFNLLDSIAAETRKERRDLFEFKRRKNIRYNPRRFKPIAHPVISEFYLQENKASDNFLLTLVYKGEEFSFPVGLLLESTSAKKIQRTYGKFYREYTQSLEARRLSRKETEEAHSAYLEPFPLLPLSADFLTDKGETVIPTLIHIVDFTADTVYIYNSMELAFFDTKGQSAIVIVDSENRVGMLEISEFPKFQTIGWRRQLTFDMKPNSEETLAELLNKHP
ncbi:MAG: hypothetical protein AB8B53_01845 [Flavobacteriales bacterium]